MGSHEARITAADRSLAASTAAFIAYLEQLPDRLAVESLPGGWTPAGHASHLTLTNDVFLGVLRGTGPLTAFEAVSDFSDERWHLDAPPTGVVAPSILVPPSGIGCVEAIAQLRASIARLRPAITALDPTLAKQCVRLPWNVVSVYQMTEWAGGHTVRHLRQISRELQLAAAGGATV